MTNPIITSYTPRQGSAAGDPVRTPSRVSSIPTGTNGSSSSSRTITGASPGRGVEHGHLRQARHRSVRVRPLRPAITRPADGRCGPPYRGSGWAGPTFTGTPLGGYMEQPAPSRENLPDDQAELASNVSKIFGGNNSRNRPLVLYNGPKDAYSPSRSRAKDSSPRCPACRSRRCRRIRRRLCRIGSPARDRTVPHAEDRDEIIPERLTKQGGLDKCWLAFYKDGNFGDIELDNGGSKARACSSGILAGHLHVHTRITWPYVCFGSVESEELLTVDTVLRLPAILARRVSGPER